MGNIKVGDQEEALKEAVVSVKLRRTPLIQWFMVREPLHVVHYTI